MKNLRSLTLLIAILAGAMAISHAQGRGPAPSKPEGEPKVTASGVKYWDVIVGDGSAAAAGKKLRLLYTGWLEDGTKFDSSYDRGKAFEFVLGAGQVIKGWDEGLPGMKAGGKRQLRIPPELAYGERGFGYKIPPNATLIFDIELLAVGE